MPGPCPRPEVLERAGSCWQDPLAEALSRGRPHTAAPSRGCARSRPLRVVYVLTREPQPLPDGPAAPQAEPPPLRCLREACAQLCGPRPRPQLQSLPFATLALGDTAALDSFYNAGEGVLGTRAGQEGLDRQDPRPRGDPHPSSRRAPGAAAKAKLRGACLGWAPWDCKFRGSGSGSGSGAHSGLGRSGVGTLS